MTKSRQLHKVTQYMPNMDSIRLEVSESYPEDKGRCIARLDPDSLLKLSCTPSDHLMMSGNRETVAKVWRSHRSDWDEGKVLIDRFTRLNAQVELGDEVDIAIKSLEPIEELRLLPYKGFNLKLTEDAVGLVKKQLYNRPVRTGDVVPIFHSANQDAIPLVVAGPAGLEGIISKSTTINFSDDLKSSA